VQKTKLTENIPKLFDSHLHEGKATLQLQLPEVHIFIQNAVPSQLREFMKVIEEIRNNPAFDIESLKGPESRDNEELEAEENNFLEEINISIGAS